MGLGLFLDVCGLLAVWGGLARMRRVRPDDYEPWLAELIASGEIEPPDEFVIEDSERLDEAEEQLTMTAEQRKWYLAGANDMEAGRLVTKPDDYDDDGWKYTTEKVAPHSLCCENRKALRASALTAEEARLVAEKIESYTRISWSKRLLFASAHRKLSLIANGENDV